MSRVDSVNFLFLWSWGLFYGQPDLEGLYVAVYGGGNVGGLPAKMVLAEDLFADGLGNVEVALEKWL